MKKFAFPLLVAAIFVMLGHAEVIELTNANFEHLTQAATGATTGDWLVKFYAPWCGHCKKLEPTYERVAEELEGTVNVARVDVMANRDLGTRFEIQGFPTLLLLSKGHVYPFHGLRSQEEIVEFARGGFQIQEPQPVPKEMGWFGEVAYVYRHAYKQAGKDIHAGEYFTMDIFLAFMPAIFVIVFLFICLLPTPPLPTPKPKPRTIPNNPNVPSRPSQPTRAAPPTSETDSSKKDD